MTNFTEVVGWDTPDALRDNLTYGLDNPVFENISTQREGISILGDTFGRAIYNYDLGRFGTITALHFKGKGLLKFRIKTANTIDSLETTNFEGTDIDSFPGTIFDVVKYTSSPNAYNVQQNNSLQITGSQTSSGIFINPAKIILNTSLSNTYSVQLSSQLLVGDSLHNSGSFTFLGLDDGVHDIEVQKYQAQIRTRIVDTSGASLGRDVSDNDIILGEPVDINVNGVLTDTTNVLTDGVRGSVKDLVVDPVVVDDFFDLKHVDNLVNFFGRTSLQHDCVRILGIRADYSLTGILADMQKGLFYRPTRINGYYALQVPIVGPKADLFANKITSYNLVSSNYIYAEVNDVWTATILLPAGVHYYRFSVDGQAQLDSANPNIIQLTNGQYSVLGVSSTQFVEFVYRGKADRVFLTGSFNGFSETTNPMNVGFDPSEILKITLGDTYFNSHSDWHKIEVEFKQAIPVVGVRFLTGVPFKHKQRVKILLDEAPITKDEWELACAPEEIIPPGVSECATYSNLLAGNFQGGCQSYFVNNTDTITASEDGWVEWHFTNQPINNRQPHYCRKFAFLTRLENGAVYNRSHKGLEILVPADFTTPVTDYIISDNELEFRSTRQTEVGLNSTWDIPQVVLQNGVNVITPMQILNDTYGKSEATYGDSISITRNNVYSFIEQINQSGVSLNNVEIACTLANTLTQEIITATDVLDLGSSASASVHGSPRFTREAFTRANDRLRVVVINIDIEPANLYYLHLVGEPSKFLLEIYQTLENAQNRVDRLGYAESVGYGFQILPTFVSERPVNTLNGPVNISVDNIIVCFDQYAANTIFETEPRANI